eukprot:scaffold3686_cov193-Alexandrium_tamarense.AAC.17
MKRTWLSAFAALIILIITTLNSTLVAAYNDSCLLYLAESTIPSAGIGMFLGQDVKKGQLLSRNGYGDAAFATVDQNWHNSNPGGTAQARENEDYHWPLTSYDWTSESLGVEDDAEDVSMTVTGFGAVPNCHFRLLNVEEHKAEYDNAGLDRYSSPGSGAITPYFNRTSTAREDIPAGAELYVNYGTSWFLSRDGVFSLVPVQESYIHAQKFLNVYGKLILGTYQDKDTNDGGEWKKRLGDKKNMILPDEAQRDLWDIIKSHPYPSRERQACPDSHADVIRAIHGGIEAVEVENSMRSLRYLKENGKCMDNIVPGMSAIPHAGRGAFATRFIPKGSLVAPAPVVHIADKTTLYMYNETSNKKGKRVKKEDEILSKQIILNYMFGHPNSSVLLFPYSSNVAYINHDSTNYNAELQWTSDFSFFHHKDWLNKTVQELENEWTAGLMLDFIATRDIQPGEEVLINYGDEWQRAWDEHVKAWEPSTPDLDHNNLTYWTKSSKISGGDAEFKRAEVFNADHDVPIKTTKEQATDPYPYNVETHCYIDPEIGIGPYSYAPQTTPFIRREWKDQDWLNKTLVKCNVTERHHVMCDEEEDEYHNYVYTVQLMATKRQGKLRITERYELFDTPSEAIRFVNKRYTSDMFLKKAFRHEMHLPDAIFPRSWMNLL